MFDRYTLAGRWARYVGASFRLRPGRDQVGGAPAADMSPPDVNSRRNIPRVVSVVVSSAAAAGVLSWGQVTHTQSPATDVRAIDDAVLRDADRRPSEWLAHGRTPGETRFSPLTRVNVETVKDLGLAWSFPTDSNRGLEATPLMVDGVLYTTASWSVVIALDAQTGRQLWKWDPEVPRAVGQKACCDVVNRGPALYRGRVYVGTLDGRFVAYQANTGEKMWDMAVGSPIAAAPITYEIDGTQFIAVMAAWGGVGGANPMGPAVIPGRVLVFGLGGKANLPSLTTIAREPPTPMALTAPADDIQAGAQAYARRCSMCHGSEVVSSGLIPDLRYSPPAVFERYPAIVLGGALAASGMPSFKQDISEIDVAAIRAYVLSRRAEVSKPLH